MLKVCVFLLYNYHDIDAIMRLFYWDFDVKTFGSNLKGWESAYAADFERI